MRAVALPVAFAAWVFTAWPAAAQPFGVVDPFVVDALQAQQQLAQQRSVAEAGERMALESNLRAQQAITDLQLQRLAPIRLPPPPPGAPAPRIDPADLPSIPDAALADSDRRVREASQRR